MKRTAIALTVAAAVLLAGAPTAAANAPTAAANAPTAKPVPGRFCKTADIGKKVMTPKYGLVVCKKDGNRARWKRR